MKYKCIDKWLKTGDLLKEIIACSDDKNIPIIKFIYRSYDLSSNNYDSKELNAQANKIIETFDRKSDDIRAFFLFLNQWAILACNKGRYKEASAIFNRLAAINAKELPKELISNRLRLKGLIQSILHGDKLSREKYIKESIELLPGTSKLKYLALYEYAVFLAQGCRYIEIVDTIKKYKRQNHWPPHFLDCLDSVKLIHYYTTYQMEKAYKLHKSFNDQRTGGMAATAIKIIQHHAEMIKNNYQNLENLASQSSTQKYSFYELIDISTYYLAENKQKESLKWAQKLVKEYGNPLGSTGFFSYTLVRAELANHNERSARKQLTEKMEMGGFSFLDDFFWTRIELLADNFDLALSHFIRVLNSCEKYEANKVLENEINLAVELKQVDLFNLYQGVISAKPINQKLSKKNNKKDSPNINGINKLIGESHSTKVLKDQIKKFASLKSSVLIMGETGVGKEVVARALHEESDRRNESFLAINCGAINESLLQSELFGHVAGAYTGAEKAHKGIFEAAGTGTVFLDEIGEISPGLQVALLRVLETGEIRPVGSAKSKPYQARILAATNAPLENLVDEGKFRMDLLYRLKKLVIQIQPLRERPNDILALTQYFFQEQSPDDQTPTLSIRLLNAFKTFNWPGNVRELKNEIERMRLLHSEKLEYDLEDSFILAEKKKKLFKEKAKSPKIDQDLHLERIRSNKKVNKRTENIKEFFIKHKSLTRNEVSLVMKMSLPTTTTYLKKLIKEGFIEKVKPSPSPRSHYFILKK